MVAERIAEARVTIEHLLRMKPQSGEDRIEPTAACPLPIRKRSRIRPCGLAAS
jgi:hypothetical protein